MKENIAELLKLGKIPNEEDMTNDMFDRYDMLLQGDEPLTYDEAEVLIGIFSDDCYDLNWGLLHAIESVDFDDVDKYKQLIAKCNNAEFREVLEIRLNNYLNN